MVRRSFFEGVAPSLSPMGFKILADLIACAPRDTKLAEVGYSFRPRKFGESKLDARVAVEFIGFLLNRVTRGILPPRFIFFALVGASGVLVHIALLTTLHANALGFALSQSIATLGAMTTNYLINNQVTYSDARLRGLALVGGALRFYLVCALGAFANLSVATQLFGHGVPWYLAGLAGVVMGSVWNFVLASALVWRRT